MGFPFLPVSELWVAAGVTAAAAVGSSAYGAYNSSKGSGGAALPSYKPVKLPAYNPQAGAQDLAASYPTLQNIAGQATQFMTNQREQIMPGSKNQFRLASNTLQSYLQGQVPQDVVNFTNRQVAQRTGGGFNPFTGGGQAPSDFARSIGQTSANFQQAGLSAAPTWLSLANSFVVNPITQVGPLAAQFGQQRYAYDALNAGVQLQNAQSQYYSGANQAFQNQIGQQQQAAQIGNTIGVGANALQAGAALYGRYNPTATSASLGTAPSYVGQLNNQSVYRPSSFQPPGGQWQGAKPFLGNYSTGVS